MDINVLIPLYICILSFNLLYSTLLWLNTKALHYKIQSLAYLSFLITGALQNFFSESSYLIRGLLASTVFFALLAFTKLISIIVRSRFDLKYFLWVYLIGIIVTLFFYGLGFNVNIMILPSLLGAVFPMLSTAVRELFFNKSKPTFITKCLIWTGVLQSLHMLDYAYAVDKPELMGLGFSIATFCIFSFVMFSSAAVMESTSIENAKIKLQMQYRTMLTNSSKLASLGEMAGGVAHEINNPLTVILLQADVIKNALLKKELNHEVILPKMDAISDAVQRIVKVITNLRYFSRDSSNDPLVEAPILDVINQTLSFCEARFKENGVEIIKGNIPHLKIRCRPAQLAQALLNLLNNSFEAVLNNPANQKIIRIEVNSTGQNIVTVRVSDNGPGIPKEIRDKVFDPFFTTKDIGEGMGLGLSVSLGMIESQKGSLKLDESSPETCFVIELHEIK